MDKVTIAKKLEACCLTATVTVIEGCDCPDNKPWYNCACRDVQTTDYSCICHNFEDVLSEDALASTTPTVEAVAHLINKHPKAKFAYIGCKHFWHPEYGYGDHFALAKKAAKR
jgi:hypothetical protein